MYQPQREKTMWKFVEKPRTILASASLIKEFVDMEPAPYDRPLSERRLMVYERILKAGAFRPVVWASAVCYETNCTYRVNGKHTSLMLSKLDKIPEFHVTIERYGCDTLKDVSNLYNTFDSNLANRSVYDINASFAAAIPELRGVPLKFINLTVSASAAIRWNEQEIRRVPPAERAEELLDRSLFVSWLQSVCGSSDTSRSAARTNNAAHLLRASVVQAMMMTYDRAPLVAKEFWVRVRDESAPDRDDPSRVLARFLVRAIMAHDKGGDREKQMVTKRAMLVKCLHAWNAHRAGERTNLQYRVDAPIPKVSK